MGNIKITFGSPVNRSPLASMKFQYIQFIRRMSLEWIQNGDDKYTRLHPKIYFHIGVCGNKFRHVIGTWLQNIIENHVMNMKKWWLEMKKGVFLSVTCDRGRVIDITRNALNDPVETKRRPGGCLRPRFITSTKFCAATKVVKGIL